MNNRRRGIALVINNIEFKDKDKHSKREGAQHDSENLKRVLSDLHFEVRLLTNQTRGEIQNLLMEESTEDHSDAHCFMCVIMSHRQKLDNNELGVLGVDGEMINILKEAKPIFSNENCSSLKNKPKLFFIDACWGNSNMGVSNSNTTKKPNSSDVSHICDTCNNSYKSTSELENNLVLLK